MLNQELSPFAFVDADSFRWADLHDVGGRAEQTLPPEPEVLYIDLTEEFDAAHVGAGVYATGASVGIGASGASSATGSGGASGATGAGGASGATGAGGVNAGGVTGGASGSTGFPTGGGSLPPSFPTYTTTASAYNITIEFRGEFTQALRDVFVQAADRIARLIVGDVPDVEANVGGVTRVVDDIYISAEMNALDGLGGVLGLGGPTAVRGDTYLPVTAVMQFDTADALNYLGRGMFDEIVTHEMLHSLGFGTVWSYIGLTNPTGYIGAQALQEYNALLIAAHRATEGFVPVESEGGEGTAGAHWSETLFGNELMTGFINAGANPLSRMSVASLADLGYTVSYAGPIDGYALG